MKQVCIIHGGSTYDSDAEFQTSLENLELSYERLLYRPRWNNWIGSMLPDDDVLIPSMPNASNAKYNEWALYFSKIAQFLRPDAILIGHSLGGIFLAKYLTEHADTLHFQKVILIAAPYDDEENESLASFKLPHDMSKLDTSAEHFALFHSMDDTTVPIAEVHKYDMILSDPLVTYFEDRGHFNTPTFPELLEEIKK